MRLIVSQILLLALAVSGQNLNCWYFLCDENASGQTADQSHGQILEKINYFSQVDPKQQYFVANQQPSQTPDVPKLEPSQYKPVLQNFVTSQYEAPIVNQQPSQNQYSTWVLKEQPIQTQTVPKVESSHGVSIVNQQPSQNQYSTWVLKEQPIQTPDAPKVEVAQQKPVFSNFVTSQYEAPIVKQQPSQNQYSTWVLKEQPIQTQTVPKVESSHGAAIVNQQTSQNQYSTWVLKEQPIQTPDAPKVEVTQNKPVISNFVTSQYGAPIVNQQPSQNQYSTWVLKEQPIQTQTVPKEETKYQYFISSSSTEQNQNQQPIQSQDATNLGTNQQYVLSHSVQTPDVQQYISLPQNVAINSQPSQSQVPAWTVGYQPLSIPENFDFYYQQPNRFLVNFVSYPMQEPSQSQDTKQSGQALANHQENTATANTMKTEKIVTKIENNNQGSVMANSVNVDNVKLGQVMANTVNVNSQKSEQILPKPVIQVQEPQPDQSHVNAMKEEIKVQSEIKEVSQNQDTPVTEKIQSQDEIAPTQPTQSQDTAQVSSESKTTTSEQ